MIEACQRAAARASWASSLGAGPGQVSIDPNGNLTSKTEGTDNWVYSWNAENQLTTVEKNGAEVVRFAYDPNGRRVEKVAGGVTATWTYEREAIVRQGGGIATLRYVHGPGIDQPLASDDGISLTYFHADGLGSITKATNSAGTVTLTRQYDAWGNQQVGSATDGYAFTGREWDPETSLHYYRARYMDSEIGRFASEDPIRFRGGTNFYSYVWNTPATAADPTGLVIQVCQRRAHPFIMSLFSGNHSYFWDPRTRNHMIPRDCGASTSSGDSRATTGVEHQDPWTTECYDVPGSEGLEDLLMICCRAKANSGTGTCWQGLQVCLDKYHLVLPWGSHMFGCTGQQCNR